MNDESDRAQAADMLVSLIATVFFRAGVKNQETLGEVEQEESADYRSQNDPAIPSLRSGNGERFRQQIEKDCAEQNARSEPHQEVNTALGLNRNETSGQSREHRQGCEKHRQHTGVYDFR